jgi:hypothetical protein
MNRVRVGLIAAVLIVGGLVVMQEQDDGCINVYVDHGPLNNGAKLETCVPAGDTTSALEVLTLAGLKIEGTQKYGNAVVCRVDGYPDKSVESCETMPPAKAYWAVIVKERQLIPIPFGLGSTWGWAQTGVNEIYLDSGDSIGLVCADNGEVRFP